MKILSAFGFIVAFVIVVAFGFSSITYIKYDPYIREKSKLLNYKDQGILLSDRNSKPFYFINNAVSDEYISLRQMSPNVLNAVMAAEDRTFYEHNGVSPRGILRSFILNAKSGRFAFGGSTLTQQLVKNTLLSSQKSLFRKAQEAVLAFDVEARYTKNEILEMYLNTVYFGEGAIGIERAAQTYFAKDAKDLTLAEAAYLAGMLKFPSLVSPYSGDKELGDSIQDTVLDQMVVSKMVTRADAEKAKKIALVFKRGSEQLTNEAPHFSLMVVDTLKEMFGNDVVYEGYKVKTSLDLPLQTYAQEVVKENVTKNKGNGVTNGSLVAMDPTTGQVLALVGSANWFDEKSGKVNMATTPRQPGSSFKPIVYSIAMDQQLITPATVIRDEPKTYILDPICRGKKEDCIYKPQNYDKKFRGPVTVRQIGSSM